MQRRHPYQPALDQARRDLTALDPFVVAARAGTRLTGEAPEIGIELTYWGRDVAVRWPAAEVRSADNGTLPIAVQLVIMHYLISADGTPMADRWLAFRELPDGRVYDPAFRRRACVPLARAFGEHPERFVAAAERLRGERLTYGGVSFMFRVLPRVHVAVILYGQDEEFPAEANVLFDASVRHYLPIEDVAVLGGLVAGELIRAQERDAREGAT